MMMAQIITYASRSLTKAKSHYPAHKVEFLALRGAVIKKFHEYLYGSAPLHRQQPPDLCLDDGQAGCCQSLLGGQLGQLQLSAVLVGRENKY